MIAQSEYLPLARCTLLPCRTALPASLSCAPVPPDLPPAGPRGDTLLTLTFRSTSCAKPRECRAFFGTRSNCSNRYGWLGRLDSNQGMAESKSAALPLGYAPTISAYCRSARTIPARGQPSNAAPARKTACLRPLRHPVIQPLLWRSVAQPGSAPRSGRGGRRFKSCHSDQSLQGLDVARFCR